jgi:NAD(P)-dependent dehydrogenase (short-subunit alcohol dehydrogenase family)
MPIGLRHVGCRNKSGTTERDEAMTQTKAIFITGGGSGIGQATAKLFAARGWRVGIADVDEKGLAATRAMLNSGIAETYVMDVRDRDAWVACLDDFTAKSGGRLDVLFNNAGIGTGGPIVEMSFEDLDRVVAINLTGVLNGAKIGHAYLARTPGSCLLNTASASAIYGSSGLPVYSATKFGVRALTEALDGEWHGAGIKVRDLIPGFIDTPLLAKPAGNSNQSIREVVTGAGLELTGADTVAEAAWAAVHGDRVHTYVGKTADRMAFAARWMPGRLRKMMRRGIAGE